MPHPKGGKTKPLSVGLRPPIVVRVARREQRCSNR